MKKIVSHGFAALAVLGLVAGSTVQAQAEAVKGQAKSVVKLENQCGDAKPVARPKKIIFTCADAYYGASGIKWQYWGRTNAIGTGEAYMMDCSNSCAAGKMVYYPAQFVATRVKDKKFTKVVVIFNGKRPFKRQADTQDLSWIK